MKNSKAQQPKTEGKLQLTRERVKSLGFNVRSGIKAGIISKVKCTV